MTNHESEAWCANLYDMIERLRYRLENLENNHKTLLQEIQNLKEK
jgi:chaperonin cofactor prefoldin